MTAEEKDKLYTAIGYSGSSHSLALPKQVGSPAGLHLWHHLWEPHHSLTVVSLSVLLLFIIFMPQKCRAQI